MNTIKTLNMKDIKTYKLISLLVLLVTFVSCSDDFLEVEDLDEFDITTVFQTEEDLTLALNNLYRALPILDIEDALFNQNADQAYVVPYFWTDDAIHRNIANSAGPQGSDYQWGSGTRSLRTFYRYQDIADINFFLETLPGADFETESNRVRFAAEARFLRAWIYESMVLAYGDVPLVTTTILPTENPTRTPRQEVFDFVISELNEIDDILPTSYTNQEDQGRITKGAVLALKSRAFLNALGWHSDSNTLYTGAEAACQEIINSGVYSLANGIDGFREQFTPDSDFTSPETVLATIYELGINVSRFALQVSPRDVYKGPNGSGNNQRRPGFTSDFIEEVQTINGLFPIDDPDYDPADPWTNRDPRLAVTAYLPLDEYLGTNGVDNDIFQPHPDLGDTRDRVQGSNNNPTGYGFKKYTDYFMDNNIEGNADLKVIRYSEVLLMYAEALAGLGRDAEALTYLDMVRNRVGMPLYADIGLPTVTRGTTGNQMIDAILLERRYEFAGEGPQRWFDIWRYRLGDQVITTVTGIPDDVDLPGDLVGPKFDSSDLTIYQRVWNDQYYLLPIFVNFLDANENLEQNPGY
tara:strand:- start:7027 stop:8769 length:1743 start_codon:yes stop_codon:yes gene_type:complete